MRSEHIKGWMVEVRKKEKEEAAAVQKEAAEGTTEVPEGTGWEDTDERREETPVEMSK